MYISDAIIELKRILNKLQLQAATEGISVDPKVPLRIEDISQWIQYLREIRNYAEARSDTLPDIDTNALLIDVAHYLQVDTIRLTH